MNGSAALAQHEARAQHGIIEFAEEMQAIREGKLYPNAGETRGGKLEPWKTYCEARWAMSDRTVDVMVQALPVIQRRQLAQPAARAERATFGTAAVVSALPVEVQDVILDNTETRDDVRAKAKAVRKATKRIQTQEGREPNVEELVEVAQAEAPKPKKPKRKMKASKFVALLSPAEHYSKAAADYARTNALSDTENDYGWAFVERVRLHMDTIAAVLYQPEHVKDWDQEAAALLGGDES